MRVRVPRWHAIREQYFPNGRRLAAQFFIVAEYEGRHVAAAETVYAMRHDQRGDGAGVIHGRTGLGQRVGKPAGATFELRADLWHWPAIEKSRGRLGRKPPLAASFC
jgi:hypothetical protein